MGTASSVSSKISERTQNDSDKFVRSIRLISTTNQYKHQPPPSPFVHKKSLDETIRKHGFEKHLNGSSTSTPAMGSEPSMKPLRSTSSSAPRLKMYQGIGGCNIQNHWDAMANESRVRLPVHKKWRKH